MIPTTRRTMPLLLCWLVLPSHLAAQDSHPLADVGQVEYEFMLGNQTVGYEQVTFHDDGWSAEGRFERGGNRRKYSVRWLRTAESAGEWRVSGTRGDIRCVWSNDSIAIFDGDAQQATAHEDRSGESDPLFYENLVWAVYSEMAVRLFAAKDVAPKTSLTLYKPQARLEVVATVRSITTRRWQRNDKEAPVELRDVVLSLGDLEIHGCFTALKNARLMNLSETADREDVLDYTTQPLARPVQMIGPIELVVWVQTNVPDTDVCAKLLRLGADGTMRRITGGIQRLRYRNGPGTDSPVEAGTTAKVTVQLRATGICLSPGDRLRLEVSSSEFPSFERNPNTLTSATTSDQLRVATTRVLHDAKHPSHLVLPVVPDTEKVQEISLEED